VSQAGSADLDADSTFQLLERSRDGDAAALDALFARYLKPLQRWASGRLPPWARNAADTHDLVQETLLSAFRSIGRFEPRREGAFQAYLRQAVMNRIRDQIRRTGTRPVSVPLEEHAQADDTSPLERAIELEALERYEAALSRLTDGEREAIIGRVEMGNTYGELARNLGKPSPDAARMTVARALVRLAEEMNRESGR
jgi:RNA polymerase sigma-70 factor (ECF subfamily)